MNRGYKGSLTVEAAYIIPLIGMVFLLSVIGIFYFHDKNVISGCAYETAVIGSIKSREKEEITEGMLETVFKERIGGKCILFPGAQAKISISSQQILVEAAASKGRMKISVMQTAKVTEPENYIRNIRRIK